MSIVTYPGFANPVDDAQAVFRAVLQAFSRPGLPVLLPALPPALPQDMQISGGLPQGMLAIALALCDNNTALWLDEAADTPQARHHLRFHCAAPITENPSKAVFAFIARPEEMPRLSAFNPGVASFPDRSATLVLSASFYAARPGQGMNVSMNQSLNAMDSLELTGPGVKGNEQGRWEPFRLGGLPSWFWNDWAENHASYPLGVDVMFVDSGLTDSGKPFAAVLGLPRTARVRKR